MNGSNSIAKVTFIFSGVVYVIAEFRESESTKEVKFIVSGSRCFKRSDGGTLRLSYLA